MYLEKVYNKFNFRLKENYLNFIDGKWMPHTHFYEKKTPITGQTIYWAARSNVNDINHAVLAAEKAKSNWGTKSSSYRANILYKVADIIENNKFLLAQAEVIDCGKLLKDALHEILGAAEHFRYFAACSMTQEGCYVDADHLTFLHIKEPLGVIGLIIPWNYPLLLASWKMAPSLAAGNTIIIKPSEQSSLSLLLLTELIKDIVPKGVINVITGLGHEAGKALANHPQINKISFTGGSQAGQDILKSAATNIIPVDLELGGKSPQIFFEDVVNTNRKYLDKAIDGLLSFTKNQGQTCANLSRAIIHKNIYNEFMEKVLYKLEKLTVGDPFHTKTALGPVISEDNLNKILKYIDIGVAEGAKLLSGGKRVILNDELANGYYIQPSLFEGNNHMCIFQEEIFGPVLCITQFADDAEAIEIANHTPFGLAASIWTKDISKAHRMSKYITAGRIWVNCAAIYPVHAAFGGVKKSGFGKESHKMTLDMYQYTKNIIIDNE